MGAGRNVYMGYRQTPADQGLYAVPGASGAEVVLAETAVSFRTSWDKVCQRSEYVVQWGLIIGNRDPIVAIGVDEIQYAKGHKAFDSGLLSDRAALHAPAMDRPGADGGELSSSGQFFTLISEESSTIEFSLLRICGSLTCG